MNIRLTLRVIATGLLLALAAPLWFMKVEGLEFHWQMPVFGGALGLGIALLSASNCRTPRHSKDRARY